MVIALDDDPSHVVASVRDDSVASIEALSARQWNALRADGARVVGRGRSAWAKLLKGAFASLAPKTAGEGCVVDILEREELFVYRDGDGALINKRHAPAINTMLKHGVRVYLYPGMSHLKAAIYDGWACFGSANLDNLSLRVNRELNIATSHAPAVDALMERVFEPDMERATKVTKPVPTDLSR